MKIEIIPCLKDNYSYLLINEKKKIACVIDPGESDPIIKYLENKDIKLKFILNTHHHYDHINGNEKLKRNTMQPLLVLKMIKTEFLELIF